MRSASVVIGAEYARAGMPDSRAVVASALQRADEPGELLAYWLSRYGRPIPSRVKRGVADAVRRLYTERALLKWDGAARGWRFGDVIEMVHPRPSADWQGDLFKFALDRRRHADATTARESGIPARAYSAPITTDADRIPTSSRSHAVNPSSQPGSHRGTSSTSRRMRSSPDS
jgi:hypothetical protein